MGGSRRGGRAAVAAAVAGVLVLLAAVTAGPAAAKVLQVGGGQTRLVVPPDRVRSLTQQDLAVVNIAPVAFRFIWDDALSWSLDLPVSGGTFDAAAKKATVLHKGGFRFVNVATDTTLRLTGLRVVVSSASSAVLSAAVGNAPVTRADVMVSSAPLTITRTGKNVSVDGLQFRLTAAGVLAVQNALGVTLDSTATFALADVDFTLE